MSATAGDDDLEDLVENAPCGYLSMLPDGTIVRVNQTLLSWLDARREEVVGGRFQDLLTMPGRIYHDTHYMPLLAMQGVAREIAFDLFRRGKPPLSTMVTTATARRDDAGQPVLYRAVVFESSSRRSYERELLARRRAAEQESTARSALLAMLSHDIRSPLSSIMMAADLLDDAAPPQRASYLGLVRRAAGSILELVNAILQHSQLEAGAAVWEPLPTDVRGLLGEIAAIHSVKADAKGIELRTAVDDAVPQRLLIDRFKLGQVVTNLLSNALKFTAKGHVLIELSAPDRHDGEVDLELRVSDTGIGIPADQLGSIFDEFKQASAAVQRRYGGSGLGLAISRKLVALAGGTIGVTSEVGAGTTFTCRLRVPVADARPIANGA